MKTPNLNPNNHSDAQAAIEAGFALGQTQQALNSLDDKPGNIPFLISSQPMNLASVEHFGAAPARMRGNVKCETPDGFVEYVKRYRTPDTVIFVRREQADLTAVLDYHQPGGTKAGDEIAQPRGGEHRAIVTAKRTPEWARWLGINKQAMSQVDFAAFLEDNLQDIAEPSGATLYEIARTFRVKKDVTFDSSVNLANGQVQLKYHESVEGGGSSAGNVSVPEKFVLGIAPYYGNQLFKVDVRFRYRLQEGGRLAVWIDIVRLDDLLLQAFDQIVAGVKVCLSGGDTRTSADDTPPVYIEGTAPTTKEIWGQ